jgi:hypothetical protein
MDFYLGTHETVWLKRVDFPLFISHRRLARHKRLPQARVPWALDSGGYSELSMYGEWRTSEHDYLRAVVRYTSEIGGLRWCAPQDWMCEPWILEKTRLSVAEHQRRTIDSFLWLQLFVPVVPVLQGWTNDDYLRHVDMYDARGIDLTQFEVVGLGSVCRRQATAQVEDLVVSLKRLGLRLHGFGVKADGLARYGHMLDSADSMAWSFAARRRRIRLPGCTHKSCSNCIKWATQWRGDVVRALPDFPQLSLLAESV